MMDAVEHACLTSVNDPTGTEYVHLLDQTRGQLSLVRSSAAMRHSAWLNVSSQGRGHICRCMAAALRDALNEMLAEPVADELACERWTPELKQALLEFHREAPHPTGPDPDGWYDTADERKAEIFARPGMFKDAD